VRVVTNQGRSNSHTTATAVWKTRINLAAKRTSFSAWSSWRAPNMWPSIGGIDMVNANTITIEKVSKRVPSAQAATAAEPNAAIMRVAINAAMPGINWLSIAGKLMPAILRKAWFRFKATKSNRTQWRLNRRANSTEPPTAPADKVAYAAHGNPKQKAKINNGSSSMFSTLVATIITPGSLVSP